MKRLQKFSSIAAFSALFSFTNGQLSDSGCGFTPLCGTKTSHFNLEPDVDLEFELENLNAAETLFGNATIVEWEDCCLSKDTVPTELCETLNPDGVHERTISTLQPLCESNDCEQDTCSEHLVVKPVFIKSETSSCCSSCSCYGDPVCDSFNDIKKSWVLCDGREVDNANPDKCVFTKGQCESQFDHAGNLCHFQETDESKGEFWNTVQRGSPCVPNPESPRSLITMYNISLGELQVFALNIEQGERGTISKVYLTLSVGLFTMSALDCLTMEEPWSYFGNEDPETFEGIFTRNEILKDYNVGYSINDPFTGVNINIRCFSNHFEGKSKKFQYYQPERGIFVPRINVEGVIDPFLEERQNVNGFCVTNNIDYGRSSQGNTRFIEENGLCREGHDNQRRLDIVRAMCKNPATTLSHERECLKQFCNKNFLPLYSSAKECLDVITNKKTMAYGFCRGVLFSEEDIDECVDQWNEMGGLLVVQQYMDSNSGCMRNDQMQLFTSPNSCQTGVMLQYKEAENEWKDFLFLPDNYCGEEEFVFNLCQYPFLGNANLRFVQKNQDPSCDLQTLCTKVDGFYALVGLVRDQPQRVLRGGN